MAVEGRKKRNCSSASSSSDQNRRSRPKITDSCEQKEDKDIKRTCPTEDQNDKITDNKTYRSVFTKPIIKNSVIKYSDHTQGLASVSVVSKFHKEVVANQIKRFQVFKSFNSFDRRVTSIAWHTKYPHVFVAGSKGGDVQLYNLNNDEDFYTIGIGAGGSILGLKFSIDDPYIIYTASLTGRICWENFLEQKMNVIFALALSWDNWLTSLDICRNQRCIMTGDCKGCAYLLSKSGEPIWQKRKLHTSKVTHCEFNAYDPNIFVTSSNDHTVKLWDLRTVSSSDGRPVEPLAELLHLKGVNSVYFSPNGTSILTTDQHSELRVYSGPLWNEATKIIHPHRQFQHMTYMKAIWHPLEDIIIVGRYPDNNIQPNDSRTIDFYDGSDGELLHQILSPTSNIVSLASMNVTGEVLAAAAGFNVTLLKDEKVLKGGESESESDEDTEKMTMNQNKSKKKKVVAKVAKKAFPKKKVSLKKKAH